MQASETGNNMLWESDVALDDVAREDQLYSPENDLVIMALLLDQAQLGVAVFDADTARMRTMQLTIGSQRDLTGIVERVCRQFGVHQILLSARNAASHELLQSLKVVTEKADWNVTVTIKKHKDFNYLRACRALERVRIGGTWWDPNSPTHETTRREVYKFLGTYFDFENKTLIRAVGALTVYLGSEKIGNQLEAGSSIHFSSVDRVALDGIMHIDGDAFQSLQIFSREAHPSLVKDTGAAKEGFSLYGLLNRCVTRAGSGLLRQWMLAPLVHAAAINERLDAVEFFVSSDNEDILKSIQVVLSSFGDVPKLLTRIRGRCASPGEWSKLNESISSFLTIQSLLQKVCAERSGTVLPTLVSGVLKERSIVHVSNMLGNVIDFEESLREEALTIQVGVSEVLDTARLKYEDLDNVLTEIAHQIQEAHPSLSGITVQYIPQVGYVICCDVPTCSADFEFQFQEDDTAFYYKDACCRDLDSSVGDIYGFIQDLQRELVEEVTVALLQFEHSIFEMVSVVGVLDCVTGLADAARAFNHKRPHITETEDFVIADARHPLQELIVDHFIPNDISLKSTSTILIITGHNGSGKSVYLKTVGLIQVMSQIGAFVPAKEATIGTVSKILTRIHSMETASISQSSFTIDCNQVSRMLKEKHCRALFLIDEFGKGTSEIDGTALLTSVIRHLSSGENIQQRPRVVVTTHLLDMFRKSTLSNDIDDWSASSPPGESSQAQLLFKPRGVVFAMMASSDITSTSDSIRPLAPLYELRDGVAFNSNALGCALSNGIPPSIARRASEVTRLRKCGQSIPPQQHARSAQSEKLLLERFTSIEDWLDVSGETIETFRAMVRVESRTSCTQR